MIELNLYEKYSSGLKGPPFDYIRTEGYPRDYSSSVIFLLLKKDHIAKGDDQKNPPIAPIATTVAKVIGSVFGIPNRGPNKGIIDVMHPTGIRILKFTSGHLARFDI